MCFRRNKYDDFEQWCDAVKERKAESALNLDEYAKDAVGTHAQKVAKFAGEMRTSIQDGKLFKHSVSINGNSARGERFRLDLSKQSPDLQIHKDSKSHVLSFYTQELEACELNSVIIGELRVGARATFLSLDHCRVRSLLIVAGEKLTDVQIKDSWIGYLEVKSRQVHDLLIEGGTIRSVKCPAPDEENPFTGHVRFENVHFPTDLKPGFREGAQPYTNLRAHLEDLQNAPMAGLMRSIELKTERHTDRGFNKIWNYAWGWCANYGYSPGRPLWWVLGLYLVTALGLWIWDGGVLTQDASAYPGWEDWFTCNDWFRAAYLPLRPIISPLGALGGGTPVDAATLGGKIALVLQGIATYLLIGMTVVGVRKRFKLH